MRNLHSINLAREQTHGMLDFNNKSITVKCNTCRSLFTVGFSIMIDVSKYTIQLKHVSDYAHEPVILYQDYEI